MHMCNAYCIDGEHCDLVYTGAVEWYTGKPARGGIILKEETWKREITRAYKIHGMTVTRIEPAHEAPDLKDQPPEHLHSLTGSPYRADQQRWLVWYIEP